MGSGKKRDKDGGAGRSGPARAERRRKARTAPKSKKPTKPPRAPLTLRQKITLLLVGPVLLLVLEILLRIGGVAAPEPLILDIAPREGGGRWVRINRDYMEPFFARRVEGLRVPTGRCVQSVFALPKPRDTIRVAFLGASTTQGYPHPRNNTAPAFLEAMLNDCVVTGKQVEVLNLGFVAVASFPVACLAQEIGQLELDLVVVYSGQNEFFGAYGTLSAQYGGKSVSAMKFRHALFRIRLVRLLAAAIDALKAKKGDTSEKSLIEIMAGGGLTRPDENATARAAANLRANLKSIARKCERLSIPVAFCPLVSNERDVAPFGSAEPASNNDRRQLEDALATAEDLLSTQPKQALSLLETPVHRFDDSARLHYLLGRAEEAAGNNEAALRDYTRAIDLDLKPWRAPSALNIAVQEAASDSGAILADVKAAFRQEANGGPIGWNLVVDHVHPSAEGHAIVAATVARALARDKEIDWLDAAKIESMPPPDEYARRFDNGDLGRFYIAYRMASIFAASNFAVSNKAASEWHKSRALGLLQSFDQPLQRAAKARFADNELRTKEVSIHYLAAEEYLRAGQPEKALEYINMALPTVDPYSDEQIHLLGFKMSCLQKLGGNVGAQIKSTLDDIIACGAITKHFSSNPFRVLSLLSNAYGMAGNKNKAADSIEAAWKVATPQQRETIALPLAEYSIAAGRRQQALALINEALKVSPESPHLKNALSRLGNR